MVHLNISKTDMMGCESDKIINLDKHQFPREDERDQAYEQLLSFIEDQCPSLYKEWDRSICPQCGASRALFCFDCLEILVPYVDWPSSIITSSNAIQLPFRLHILLDDRRSSATGVQIATTLKYHPRNHCELFEPTTIPSYSNTAGTYILFPSPQSVPMSSVSESLENLVVLDCKWTQSSIRLHPSLAKLPQVHLDGPARPSLFWRWHNAGPGMLSTAEAIYYAAFALTEEDVHRRELVYLLWLFGMQRETIRRSSHYDSAEKRSVRPLPFTDEGKSFQRSIRDRSLLQGKAPSNSPT